MTEILKVGRASAIGSAVCVALALAIMPKFWLLGLIAGIAGGYIVGHFGYEFGKTAAALSKAFSALIGVGTAIKSKSVGAGSAVGSWVKDYQAYLVPGILVGLVLSPFAIEALRIEPYAAFHWYDWVAFFLIPVCLFFVFCLHLVVLNVVGTNMLGKKDFQDTEYRLVLFDIAVGFYWMLAFVVWYLWKFIVIGVWQLFKLVHSAQRVACGIDSVLGGVLTIWGFMRWGPVVPTFGEYLIAVFFGALIGGAIGIVMCQLLVKPSSATA